MFQNIVEFLKNSAIRKPQYVPVALPNAPTRIPANAKPMPPDSAHFGMHNDKMDHKMIDKSTQKHEMMNMSKEKHVMMQDGKVTIMRDGKMIPVKAFTPLSNGTKVMSDGTIIKKDGTKTMLKEGECLNMAGEIVLMKN